MKYYTYLWVFLLGFSPLFGQQSAKMWRGVDPQSFPQQVREIIPEKFRTVEINLDQVKAELANAPMQESNAPSPQRSAMKTLAIN